MNITITPSLLIVAMFIYAFQKESMLCLNINNSVQRLLITHIFPEFSDAVSTTLIP